MKRKICIAFAGAVGSSKSPIATYLSWNLGLPVVSNDVVRTEVIEDLGTLDKEEYLRRRDTRGRQLIQSGSSFIYDASIDREWPRLKDWLEEGEYTYFIISLDLSKDLLTHLYQVKHYDDSLKRIDNLIEDHNKFIAMYGSEVSLHIGDKEFGDRLEKSLQELKAADLGFK